MPELPLGWTDFNSGGPVALAYIAIIVAFLLFNLGRREQPDYAKPLAFVLSCGALLLVLWIVLISYGLVEDALPLIVFLILTGLTLIWFLVKGILSRAIFRRGTSRL